jgi:rhodanese-related sulfurtransferase
MVTLAVMASLLAFNLAAEESLLKGPALAGASCERVVGEPRLVAAHSHVGSDLLGQLERRGEVSRKQVCLMGVTTAARLYRQGSLMMVDVRPANEFERYGIRGSLNMTAHATRTKDHLKSKQLLLVDRGHRYAALEKNCTELSEVGFSVHVLEGGLNAWQASVEPLRGDAEAPLHLDVITPLEFHKERHLDHWRVVYLQDRQAHAVMRPDADPEDTWESRIMARLQSVQTKVQGAGQSSFLLLVTDDGRGYREIRTLAKEAGLANVYYLEGGRAGYMAHVDRQVALWNWREGKVGRKSACDYL